MGTRRQCLNTEGIQNEIHGMVAHPMGLALHAKDGCQRTRGFNTMGRALSGTTSISAGWSLTIS